MWWNKSARSALLLAAAATALTACAGGQTAPRGAAPQVANAPTPLDQYEVTVDQKPEELALAPHAFGLSQAQRNALAVYASRWRETGDAVITLQAPVGAATCACDTHATAQAAAAALSVMGVPSSLIRFADYDGGGQPAAPVVARYDRYAASTADCSKHWSNLASSFDNSASSHFGCATTQNFAAMVADPRDLLRPTPSAPADATRRGYVLDKYRQGQLTSSSKEDQALGTISNAVH